MHEAQCVGVVCRSICPHEGSVLLGTSQLIWNSAAAVLLLRPPLLSCCTLPAAGIHAATMPIGVLLLHMHICVVLLLGKAHI